MQVVRLCRKGKPRTVKEKLVEIVLATKLELKYSKKKILNIYLSNAPFGGNVVGLEAASWRYFGRSPYNLSWAESATLAVLPNAPALIFPGKNQYLLEEKRNKLLKRLLYYGNIDSISYLLSIKEHLPGKPKLLPQFAPHLLDKCFIQNKGSKSNTTININLQLAVNQLIEQHNQRLKANEIHNISAIVVEVNTGNIVAYIGNTTKDKGHSNDVDIIQAPRSTGSILKPILYASMINDGEILPQTLVLDIPIFMEGFSPKNYHLAYDGAVPAYNALSRSLNVPAVYMLRNYGVGKFLDKLNQLEFSTIDKSADYYGLSLILGGAEVTLWDLCKVYTGMARILANIKERDYLYDDTDMKNLNILHKQKSRKRHTSDLVATPKYFHAASVWFMLEALLEVNRPENETGWKSYSSSYKIAWKTGRSF
jgi:penicillin-binding protein 1C